MTGRFALHTAVLAALLLLQVAGALHGINEAVNSSLPLVDNASIRVLTELGGDAFLVAFTVLVLLLDWKNGGKISKKTLAFLVATFVGLAVVGVLKVATAEPRPRPLPGANALSAGAFPSGHTFRAAVIASYVADRWKRLSYIAWAYAVGIALTRLLLHYHWLSDVAFSLLLAPWLYHVAKELVGVEE